MSQLGNFEKWFADAEGNALTGLTVEIRKQGASANGTSGGGNSTAFVCHHPGAIVTGDSVVIETAATPVRTSTVNSKTSITLNGLGHTWTDNQRLSPTTNLPTLYSDREGIDSVANPATTDSRGSVDVYLQGGLYDVKISGTGYTTTLIRDVYVPSSSATSNVYDGANEVAHILNSDRDLTTSGALLLSVRNDEVEKFSIDKDGGFSAGATSSSAGLTLSDDLIFSLAVSQIVPGVTSLSLRNNADDADNLFVTDAGVVTVRAGLAVTAGDLTFGATASQIVPGATSIALRNNANDADNLSILDNGNTDVRGTLTANLGFRSLVGPFGERVVSQSNTDLFLPSLDPAGPGSEVTGKTMLRAGEVTGIAIWAVGVAPTGGMEGIVEVYINGSPTGLTTQIDASNPVSNYTTQAIGSGDTFNAGDVIQVWFTDTSLTSANSIVVDVEIVTG